MESSLAALYDRTFQKATTLAAYHQPPIAQKAIANEGRAEHGEEGEVAEGQEEEEEEDSDEDGEEDEEDDEGEEKGGHGGEERCVSNKDLQKPPCPVAANSPPLGQIEFQHYTQRCAKRFRASTAKERISKMPPCAAGKRSSIYRGVTRHRWTGRYEAHLWDKSTWNQTQNKKGKQVYLGAYDEEEAAARAYDLAALKYWGPGTLINFPVSDYARDIDEMQSLSREDYLATLRRKSSGFSRFSKMKAGRNNLNMRQDSQGAASFVNALPVLGGYESIRDDIGIPALDFGGALGCPPVGVINLCHFMNWLQPPNLSGELNVAAPKNLSRFRDEDPSSEEYSSQRSATGDEEHFEQEVWYVGHQLPQVCEPYRLPSLGLHNVEPNAGISALHALSRSSLFARIEQGLNATEISDTVERGVPESATAALAAALAMEDDCIQFQKEETTCSYYQRSIDPEVDPPCLRATGAADVGRAEDDSVQLSQEGESTFSFMSRNNSQLNVHYYPLVIPEAEAASCSNDCSYAYTNSLLTAPLPPLPFMTDQPVYLPDHVPGLWNIVDTPSSISMGMIF